MLPTQPEGYFTLPASGTGQPVLVLHAWWGLNDTLKAFCWRLAEAGFVALAPDLYHGKIADTIPAAEALGRLLDANYQQARAEIVQAAQFLNAHAGRPGGGISVVGFSLGAFYALDLSTERPELIRKVVVYYGSGVEDFGNSGAAYLGHFAEQDDYEPPAQVDHLDQSIRAAGRPVTIYRYPGTGHWFCEPDRLQAYHPAAAALAWERTLAFLQDNPT